MTLGMHGTGVRLGLGDPLGPGAGGLLGVGVPVGVPVGVLVGVLHGGRHGVPHLRWLIGGRTATVRSGPARDGQTIPDPVMVIADIALLSAVA